MYEGEMLQYGRINERSAGANIVPVPMAASQVIAAASGRFVYMNAGAATLCISTTQTIFGFLQTHAHTPATSAKVACEVDLKAIYRVPVVSGTFVNGMIGDVCDLVVTSGVQGVALGASTHNIVTIVGGDTTNNKWCDVMMNPEEWSTGAGADD